MRSPASSPAPLSSRAAGSPCQAPDQYVNFGAAKKVLSWPLAGFPAGLMLVSLMLESDTAAGCTFRPLLLSVTTTPTKRTMLYQQFWPRPSSPCQVPLSLVSAT